MSRGTPLRRAHDPIALHAMLPVADQALFTSDDLDLVNPWTIEGRYPTDTGETPAVHIDRIINASMRIVTSSSDAARPVPPPT